MRRDLSYDFCEFLLRGTSFPRERLLDVLYRCAPLGNIWRSSMSLLRGPKSCNLFHLSQDHIICKRIATFLFRTSPEFEIIRTCSREVRSSPLLLLFCGDLIG